MAKKTLARALTSNSFESVKLLVEQGADLNDKENPSFLEAVRYCDEKIIRYLVDNGADIHARGVNDVDAFQSAIYGNKIANLQLIHALGHTVQEYGGSAFRSEMFEFQRKANPAVLEFFVKNGVDIDYNGDDDVQFGGDTPLCVAARYSDLDRCKFLVEHGADVTISGSDGMRPYNIAVQKGDHEMASYFKSLEPENFHNMKNKLMELKSYKLPKNLMDFLQRDNLHFQTEPAIEFFPLVDTVPMKIGKNKLLRISKWIDDYSHIHIVWNPKKKCICFYDEEHGELGDIGNFDNFVKDMQNCLDKIEV